jgi:hypothetical protein
LLRAASITACAAALASAVPTLVRERACADTTQWQAADAGQLCMQNNNLHADNKQALLQPQIRLKQFVKLAKDASSAHPKPRLRRELAKSASRAQPDHDCAHISFTGVTQYLSLHARCRSTGTPAQWR